MGEVEKERKGILEMRRVGTGMKSQKKDEGK